jgi:hypothetical protein
MTLGHHVSDDECKPLLPAMAITAASSIHTADAESMLVMRSAEAFAAAVAAL